MGSLCHNEAYLVLGRKTDQGASKWAFDAINIVHNLMNM